MTTLAVALDLARTIATILACVAALRVARAVPRIEKAVDRVAVAVDITRAEATKAAAGTQAMHAVWNKAVKDAGRAARPGAGDSGAWRAQQDSAPESAVARASEPTRG